MLFNLAIGILCLITGLVVASLHVVRARQAWQGPTGLTRDELAEFAFFTIFLGLLPLVAGMIFLVTWWQHSAHAATPAISAALSLALL